MNQTRCLFSNCTQESCERKCEMNNLDVLLLCGYLTVLIIGSFGNSLVLIVQHVRLKEKGTLNLLVYLLATSDLSCSIISPSLVIYWIVTCNCQWHFGVTACKIIPTLSRIFADISIGILLIMAIDRYRAIVTPMKLRFSRSAIQKSFVLTILLSVLCQLYYAMELNVVQGKCIPERLEDIWYKYPLVILVSARILAFILIFSITTIAVQIALRPSKQENILGRDQQQVLKRSAKVMKMLVVMAIVFIITVLPRDLLHLAYTLSYIIPGKGIPYS